MRLEHASLPLRQTGRQALVLRLRAAELRHSGRPEVGKSAGSRDFNVICGRLRALAPSARSTYAFTHAISRKREITMAVPRFQGTDKYVATDDLRIAVNASIALERPLLVKGEPGTGKTELAFQVADFLKAPLITWHVKSTTKAMQGLYEYDAVTRLRDSQLGDVRVKDVKNYIKKGKLWEAFEMKGRPVLLIDEIDKADIEFPNDLLLELDRMEFFVYETGETIKAVQRPIILITSNNEKELPDAFLRRCFFHYIKFPERDTMQKIIDVHYPNIKQKLVSEALNVFYQIRDVPGLKKKPSTSELLDWLKLLLNEDIPPEALKERDPTKLIPPLHGALLKNEQDVHLFERLAFLARREPRN
jgi:MoxR-like ATPase